jgi:hypothetical protein
MRLTSQNCGLYGPTVHPRLTAMWTIVWWYRLGLTPNSSTRALWQPPVLSGGPFSWHISEASRRMDEGNENLVYPSPYNFKSSLICRKMLRHGTFPLYFPSERKVCCGILSPLKFHHQGDTTSVDEMITALLSLCTELSTYLRKRMANLTDWCNLYVSIKTQLFVSLHLCAQK